MKDWNVVVTAREKGYDWTRDLLKELKLGPFARTEFYNVLVMKVDDVGETLRRVAEIVEQTPSLFTYGVSRIAPAQHTFTFQSPEEFETKARDIVLSRISELGGRTFHVRLHRRGFKGRLSSHDEERFLDRTLLDALELAGRPGALSFDDPDAVIQIETVGNRAGISLWSRAELDRYPFLHVD